MPWPGWKVTSALVSTVSDGVTGLGQLVRQRHREAGRVRGGDELLGAGDAVGLLGAGRPADVVRRRSRRSRARRWPLPSESEPSQWALAVRVVAMRSPSCSYVGRRASGQPSCSSDTMTDVRYSGGGAHLLRRGRRRGDVPAPGAPLLRRASPTTRSCGRCTRRRTSTGAEERLRMFLVQYWGGPRTYQRAARPPAAADAARAVPDRPARAGRLAAPHARGRRRARAARRGRGRCSGTTW